MSTQLPNALPGLKPKSRPFADPALRGSINGWFYKPITLLNCTDPSKLTIIRECPQIPEYRTRGEFLKHFRRDAENAIGSALTHIDGDTVRHYGLGAYLIEGDDDEAASNVVNALATRMAGSVGNGLHLLDRGHWRSFIRAFNQNLRMLISDIQMEPPFSVKGGVHAGHRVIEYDENANENLGDGGFPCPTSSITVYYVPPTSAGTSCEGCSAGGKSDKITSFDATNLEGTYDLPLFSVAGTPSFTQYIFRKVFTISGSDYVSGIQYSSTNCTGTPTDVSSNQLVLIVVFLIYVSDQQCRLSTVTVGSTIANHCPFGGTTLFNNQFVVANVAPGVNFNWGDTFPDSGGTLSHRYAQDGTLTLISGI